MPGLDGMETARRMKEQSSPFAMPKILMLTAHSRAEIIDQARAAGILKVLVKPVNVSMLVDGITDALDTGSQAGSANISARRGPDPHHRPRLQGVRVLLVEDNEINQQIAKEILEGIGVTVAIAGNGNIALTALRGDGPLPDAILMDLQMPEIDGYETTRWIRADDRLKSIPVIAMTAHVTDSERQRCLAAGMVDHVSKPVDVQQLLDTLERWIETGDEPAPLETDSPVPGIDTVADSAEPAPALDLEGASKRMGLPIGVLERAAAQFTDSYRDAPTTLTDLMDREEWKEATRFAHTIAGLAGTIGAPMLAAEARAIEDALRNDDHPHRLDLQAMAQAHADVFQALDARSESRRPAATKVQAKSETDRGRLTDLIREMDRGLATNRMSVRRLVDELRVLCDQQPADDFEQLTSDLRSLNYPAAHRALRAIAAAHQIELGVQDA